MRNNSVTIIDKVTMAGTAVTTSTVVPLLNVYCYALQYIAAGSAAAGSVQIYGSCDEGLDEHGTGVSNWFTIDSATTISVIGSVLVNKDGVGYRWLKVTYTANSGTGTMTVKINTKGN